MLLKDKVVVVTGASRGIGKAIALGMAREGAQVAGIARTQEAIEAMAREITQAGGRALGLVADVSQRSLVEEAFERIEGEFGRVDVLVNNAGVVVQKPFLELTDEDWDYTINTNLKGYFICGQVAARRMAANGGGAIVNISSIRAERMTALVAPYAASKGGINSLTRAMALGLAPYRIRVNAIAPGTVKTELTAYRFANPETVQRAVAAIPIGRIGEPQDIVGAAVFLASDEASFITGAVLVLDGGKSALVPS